MAGLTTFLRDPAGVWRSMNQGQRFALMVGVALLVSIGAATYMWASAPTFVPLYRSLSLRSGGRVIAALGRMNVPYRVSNEGSTIEVPLARVDAVRLKLAAKNLPGSGRLSFQNMGGQSLGESRFAEHVQYQQALESALEHTIESLNAVSTARVNLAIAPQPVFLGDSRKSTASVLVLLRSGASLSAAQISGIQHLIASSVVGLMDKNVAVVNQDGTLLSGAALTQMGGGPGQLSYQNTIEQRLRQQILALLQPIMGVGHVRVGVAAEINFSKVQSASVSYGKGQVLSEQSRSSTAGILGAQGVPGAVSNTPPGAASAPFAAGSTTATTTAAVSAGKAKGILESNRTTNFQNNRTVTQQVIPPGAIKRLNIAVLLDKSTGGTTKGAGKQVAQSSAVRITRITALVKNAVGFDVARGDSISVTSMRFAPTSAMNRPKQPWWKSPLASMGAKYAAGLVAFLLGWMVLIRPIMRAALRRIEPVSVLSVATGMEAEVQPVSVSDTSQEVRLRETRDVVASDPAAAARIIKNWMKDGH